MEISSVTGSHPAIDSFSPGSGVGRFRMLLNKLFILFHLICFTLVFENSCTQITSVASSMCRIFLILDNRIKKD